MITRSVTVAKIRREYWQQIADGQKRFELRSQQVDYESQAFVFMDAVTGEHLGNARIIEHITGLPFDQPIDTELDDETRLAILEARAEDDRLTWAAALAIANLETLLHKMFRQGNDGLHRLRAYYKLLESFGYETTRDEQLALYDNYDPLKTEGQQS